MWRTLRKSPGNHRIVSVVNHRNDNKSSQVLWTILYIQSILCSCCMQLSWYFINKFIGRCCWCGEGFVGINYSISASFVGFYFNRIDYSIFGISVCSLDQAESHCTFPVDFNLKIYWKSEVRLGLMRAQ